MDGSLGFYQVEFPIVPGREEVFSRPVRGVNALRHYPMSQRRRRYGQTGESFLNKGDLQVAVVNQMWRVEHARAVSIVGEYPVKHGHATACRKAAPTRQHSNPVLETPNTVQRSAQIPYE